MSKKKILLTTFNVHHANHYYSLALGYLKAYATKDDDVTKNSNIEIVDFCKSCNTVLQILFYLESLKPDIVGFSCYVWNTDMILDICRMMGQVIPDTKIVLGGPEVGPVAEKVLEENKAVDVIVRGEGEATFLELLGFFVNGKGSLGSIKGISYRENNKINTNEDRPLIKNLDDIPSPHLLGILRPKDQVAYLETYRGCPYKCAYCYEGKDYREIRYFSDSRIKKEIELIMNDTGVNSFSFVDPVFNLNRKKTQELTKILSEANTHGTLLHTIEIASETINKATIDDFKRAKVVSVETGPQSANQETLENVKRHFDKEKFARGVKLCVKNGIKVLCDLIIGLPGDNFFRFNRSIDYVLSLKPGVIVFSSLNVLPGTYLYQNSKKFGLKFDDQPPHLVLATSTFPYREIRNAETLSISLTKEYQSVT